MAQATFAHAVETNQARAALARHAGMKKISFGSVVAGTLVAYAALIAGLAVAAAIARAAGVDTDHSAGEWRKLGAAGAAGVAIAVLVAYLFGGYVAGRMARRAGATNGAMVFVLGALMALGIAGLVALFTNTDTILGQLRAVGIPTAGEQWRDVGALAGAGALLSMLIGSVIGGRAGERWHAKLLMRAADPTYGPEAEERAAAEQHREALKEAQERATERHDESDDEVRKATAATAVPAPGWYEEDEDKGRRAPRHRMRAAR